VGARKESYSRNSRKPEVEPGTIQDDQERRDFTINALAISLNQGSLGALGGSLRRHPAPGPRPDAHAARSGHHLQRRSAAHAARRALRQPAGLHHRPATFEAIKRNAKRLEIISAERIHTELNKIIATPKPSIGFILLRESGLLAAVLPRIRGTAGRRGETRHRPQGQFLPHAAGAGQCVREKRRPLAALGRHPARHRQAEDQTLRARPRLDLPRPRGQGRAHGAHHLPPHETAAWTTR
jgi:poly(A) polymerase